MSAKLMLLRSVDTKAFPALSEAYEHDVRTFFQCVETLYDWMFESKFHKHFIDAHLAIHGGDVFSEFDRFFRKKSQK